MKSLFTVLFLAAGISAAQAQTNKGDMMIGASLANVNAVMMTGTTNVAVGINPMAAHFISNDFALGLALNVGAGFAKSNTSLNYGATPFARMFFHTAKKDFVKNRFFAQLQLGYQGYSNMNKVGTKTVTTTGNSANGGIGVGLAHFLNPHVALETSLMYNVAYDLKSELVTHMPALNLGFQIYLQCKEKKAKVETKAKDDDNDE